MDPFDIGGAKDGNMPQFIKNVPWYMDNNKPSQPLNHQKSTLGDPKKADINQWY